MTLTIQNLHLRISIRPIARREIPNEESGNYMSFLIADSTDEDSEIEFSEDSDD